MKKIIKILLVTTMIGSLSGCIIDPGWGHGHGGGHHGGHHRGW